MHSKTDWIQVRAKERSAGALLSLVKQVRERTTAKLIVNSRADVALVAGADGLHLPANSPKPRAFRSITPPGFLIGVSCHNVDEVRAAEDEDADYVFLSPIFSTPGKGLPLGLEYLARAAATVRIPVIALGGITEASIQACKRAGAAGIAGIRLFQRY